MSVLVFWFLICDRNRPEVAVDLSTPNGRVVYSDPDWRARYPLRSEQQTTADSADDPHEPRVTRRLVRERFGDDGPTQWDALEALR